MTLNCNEIYDGVGQSCPDMKRLYNCSHSVTDPNNSCHFGVESLPLGSVERMVLILAYFIADSVSFAKANRKFQ